MGPNGPVTSNPDGSCPGQCPGNSPLVNGACPKICFDNTPAPPTGNCPLNCPDGKPVPPTGCMLPEIKRCADNSLPLATGCRQPPANGKFCKDGTAPDQNGKCPDFIPEGPVGDKETCEDDS